MDEDSAAGSRMPVMPDAAQHSQGQGHTAHTSHYAEAGAAGGSPAAEIEDSARDVRASPILMRDLTGGRVYDPWRCKFTPRVCACTCANVSVRTHAYSCVHVCISLCLCVRAHGRGRVSECALVLITRT